MSSQFDNLLTPISLESPCGDGHIYSRHLRASFSALRKPEQPDDDQDTNFRRSADWFSVVKLAESALSEQTKDIRIVCHLIEAWTQIRGFGGLHDGLELLTSFVETCWDRSNPAIDDGDLEVRVAPLENMLDDVDRGSCFPVTVRQIPILGSHSLTCDFLTYQELHQSKEEEQQKRLEQIVAATDPVAFLRLEQDVDASLKQLIALKNVLAEKMDEQAPGLTYLRDAIVDCQRVVKGYLTNIVPIEAAVVGTQGDVAESLVATTELNGSDDGAQVELPSSDIPARRLGLQSRQDAYRQLAEVADYLKETEPHSPIPYLVGRAVELGKLPFPKLVKQLIREEGILGELRREFGITELAEETMDAAD